MKLGCIVMASGEGRRFRAAGGSGRKLTNAVDDSAGPLPLVVRTVASVPADLYEVAVVACDCEVTAAVESSLPGTAIVPAGVDGRPRRSDSVRAGASHADAMRWDGALFLPGDQPLVTRESFLALATAFEKDASRAYRLSWDGELGSPVLFPASSFSALKGLQGHDGGSSLLRSGALAVAPVEARSADELRDVDTPADLERIAAVLASRHR